MNNKTKISVETEVNAPIEKTWEMWNSPVAIVHWYSGSADWHTPRATNDLKVGGKFSYRMEAKDGSMGFDFEGIYTEIKPYKQIDYEIADGRKVSIVFSETDTVTKVTETFEAEDINSIELQQQGWQTILNNFKTYLETN